MEYGSLLGCYLANYRRESGAPDSGRNRLFRTPVSESTYMIWKTRCERTITWDNDPTRSHSPNEIHNNWLQAIHTRLRTDSVQANKKIFKKAINPKTALGTWGLVRRGLVGIAPRTPPHPARVPHEANLASA